MTEGVNPLDPLEQLHRSVKAAPQRIEDEFSRTGNNWLACYGSSVFQIETWLSFAGMRVRAFGMSEEVAKKNLERVKEQLQKLKEEHPEDNWKPEGDLRNKLLGDLDILKIEKRE